MITAQNVPNLPGWMDLGSPDPGASAEFYSRVFGWTAEQVQAESEQEPGYWYLRKDGKAVAGLGGLPDPAARSDWMTYIRVADAASTTATAEANGAKVRVPVMPIGPQGSFAQLTDPAGGEFALWQPGEFTGFEACCIDDTVLWAELWTRDPGAAKAFYPAVFGWQGEPYTEGAPEGGGQDEKWIPHLMVADADATVARATDAGGAVLIPASDAPPGRLGLLADPFGARFVILQPTPMAGAGGAPQ
ncbi:MAG: hypothetical protein AUG49_05885 [Catenulispora sp. 13_1_20CM_3_70_7]|nr:MAG: hypothetical protein AUG49_05885 [Catenulispora sp. 13_1_20CM_3_70_7]